MADKQDTHKACSTCFETLPFAEMMHKMSGQRLGSLCAEMMAKIMEQFPEVVTFGIMEGANERSAPAMAPNHGSRRG